MIIEQLFAEVLSSIRNWKKGASILSLLRNMQVYAQLPEDTWTAAFPNDERFSKEMFIEKVRALKEWTL